MPKAVKQTTRCPNKAAVCRPFQFTDFFGLTAVSVEIQALEPAECWTRYFLPANGGNDDTEAVLGAFGTRDAEVLGVLFSGETIEQLQSVNAIRNRTTGHGGIVGDDEAHRRRTELEASLATLRSTIGDVWLRLSLLKAGPVRIKSGLYEYQAERLMGRSSPFEKVTVTTTNPIEDGVLFLFAEDTGVGVPLVPLLVVGPSPDKAQNACYFYHRVDGEQLRFVSYHFENEAEIQRLDPTAAAVLNTIMASAPAE